MKENTYFFSPSPSKIFFQTATATCTFFDLKENFGESSLKGLTGAPHPDHFSLQKATKSSLFK
jgi:hypothetical protein